MYDPTVGKWISADPISFKGKDTNLYRYAGNSPIDHTDPNGLECCRCCVTDIQLKYDPESALAERQEGTLSRLFGIIVSIELKPNGNNALPCSFEWWEWSNIFTPLNPNKPYEWAISDEEGGKPWTLSHGPGIYDSKVNNMKPTLSEWVQVFHPWNYDKKQWKQEDSIFDIALTDAPQISNGQEHILFFSLIAKSARGVQCEVEEVKWEGCHYLLTKDDGTIIKEHFGDGRGECMKQEMTIGFPPLPSEIETEHEEE